MAAETDNSLLSVAIDAVQAGDSSHARDLLLRAVEADDQDEQAWYWLSIAVEDPEDKILALENVLALNPAHEAAQNSLSWWRARAKIDSQGAPAPALEGDSAGGDQDEFAFGSLLESDGAYDIFQCIWCGYLSAEEDDRCPDCRRRLTAKRHRSRGASGILRSAQLAISLLTLAAAFEGVYFYIVGVLGARGDEITLRLLDRILGFGLIFGDPRTLAANVTALLIVASLVRVAFLLLVTTGLFTRINIGYYGGIVVLIADLLFTGYRLANEYGGVGLIIANGVLALIGLYFVFSSGHDFAVIEERLECRPDASAKGAFELSRRGVKYSGEGKWGLAVAHFQASVAAAPERPELFKQLALGYMQIGRYARALNGLKEAARLDSNDAEIEELVALVNDRQAHDRKRGGAWWEQAKGYARI